MKNFFKKITDKFTRNKAPENLDSTGEHDIEEFLDEEEQESEYEFEKGPNPIVAKVKYFIRPITNLFAKKNNNYIEDDSEDNEGFNFEHDKDNLFAKSSSKNREIKLSEKFFSIENRPKIHSIFLFLVIATSSYYVGKLIALFFQSQPSKMKSTSFYLPPLSPNLELSDFNTIKSKNIFASTKQESDKPKEIKKIDPNIICKKADKKSSLPINIVNTVVLQDSVKSIASVQLRGRDLFEIHEGENLEGLAKIDKIDRQRLILKNLSSGECEFVEDNSETTKNPINVLSPTQSKKFVSSQKPTEIQNEGNKFKIKKNYLNQKLNNIGEILTQARAVQINNPDGSLCFNLQDIDPEGVFPSLGIQNNDTICEINGTKITNLNQVMDLFAKIRDLDEVDLNITRNGMQTTMEYKFD